MHPPPLRSSNFILEAKRQTVDVDSTIMRSSQIIREKLQHSQHSLDDIINRLNKLEGESLNADSGSLEGQTPKTITKSYHQDEELLLPNRWNSKHRGNRLAFEDTGNISDSHLSTSLPASRKNSIKGPSRLAYQETAATLARNSSIVNWSRKSNAASADFDRAKSTSSAWSSDDSGTLSSHSSRSSTMYAERRNSLPKRTSTISSTSPLAAGKSSDPPSLNRVSSTGNFLTTSEPVARLAYTNTLAFKAKTESQLASKEEVYGYPAGFKLVTPTTRSSTIKSSTRMEFFDVVKATKKHNPEDRMILSVEALTKLKKTNGFGLVEDMKPPIKSTDNL